MGKKIRLLVVEDDDVQRLLITRILDRFQDKLHVRCETSIATAQAALYHEDFDIVVTDFVLPDGKGSELINPDSYPLLVMTSQGSQEIAAEIMKAGANDYLVKSQDLFNELPHVVQRAMREWKLETQNKKILGQLDNAHGIFLSLFEQYHQGMVITDTMYNIIHSNDAAKAVFNEIELTGNMLSLSSLSKKGKEKLENNQTIQEKLKIKNGMYPVSAKRIHVAARKDEAFFLFTIDKSI